jgi:hypothetical protein
MKIKVGDWIVVTQREKHGLDEHYEHTEENPKYLYGIGAGGRVIHVDRGTPLVEFHWGRYNYQQTNYQYQAKEKELQAKGGWYVGKNCLTVLPKGLTIKQMRALGKVLK